MNQTRAPNGGESPRWDTLNITDGQRTLIEASAGTGKTWTIAALYLRLIIDRGLSARQIVVTTFTNSAAQELRERLREALVDAELLAVQSAPEREPEPEPASDAARAAWLAARWRDDPPQRGLDLERLRLALAQLDIAPIGTLHQLCMRILADQPFACGVEFVLPALVAGDAVLDEVADDVWRIASQTSTDDARVRKLVASGVAESRVELRRALGLLLKPGVTVANRVTQIPAGAGAWANRVREMAGRDKVIMAKQLKLKTAWLEFAAWLAGADDASPGKFALPLRDIVDDACFTKKALLEPEVRAVRQFTIDFLPWLNSIRLNGLAELSALGQDRLQATLRRRHQLRFDDLLIRVAEPLELESGAARRPLADALHDAWPVALIDEFQDTDGVQFGILDAIFRDGQGQPRGALVMIGDPKQAIYRFRGGDIDAYLRAAAAAKQTMTLRTNHRSARALVAAMNELFAVAGDGLSASADAPIRYSAVDASTRCDQNPYTIAGAAVTKPLAIHMAAGERITAVPLRTRALIQCANQIARLLQSGDHRIGDRPVTSADIAVLLPTAKAIRRLRDLLRERNVLCVTSDQTSVFRTDTARELQILLHAVVHAGDLGALRAAISTRLYGYGFADLQRLVDDAPAWHPIADQFHQWHAVWAARGVMAVVEKVLECMAARFLATPQGERAITDLRHLGELLQAQDDLTTGREELLVWFARQRSDAATDEEAEAADAAQLRIESDGDRVRIMTLHASKGLEFPLVFLPLMWDHNEFPAGRLFVVHADGRREIDVSSAAEREELRALQDERFRVLYVALTRAIHACHVYAPPREMMETGVGTRRNPLNVMLERMHAAGDVADAAAACPHIDWIDGWRFADFESLSLPIAQDRDRAAARPLPSSSSGPTEMRHSFTTLTQFTHARLDPDAAAADEVDIDIDQLQITGEVASDEGRAQILRVDDAPGRHELARLSSVRGADFGNAVHAIFEHRRIGVALAQQSDLVADCLAGNGVRRRDMAPAELVAAVAARLDAVLRAPLGLDGSEEFCLGDLAPTDLRAEMEFHFALDRVSMQRLREACERHGDANLVPSSHARLSGLMTGKIDLVFRRGERFHVLDYKSNWLGDGVADYSAEALEQAMDASHYRFQALIYSIAVVRYLRERMGDNARAGECIYLFVRAAGLGSGAGIWRHRFDDALLAAVDDVLAGAWRQAA